jgi:plastocyanin
MRRLPVVSSDMRRIALVALIALLVPVAAGCGGDEDGGGDGDGGEAAAQTIELTATDFQFEPADLTADPGEITFVMNHDGDFPHALEIEGEGVEETSETVATRGDSTELTVQLEEGTYEIYCPVGDHTDRGMVGTLTVGGGGAGGAGTTDGETRTGTTDEDETETGEDTGTDDSSGQGGGY